MAHARPGSLDEALALLARGTWRVLAGGTDLYPATQAPALPGDILDVTAIPDLRGLGPEAGGLRIGAAVSWAEVARAGLPPACDALRAAAREVGGVQIQNAGTVGGNLCNASPAADGVPPLLVLDAEVELAGPGGRRRLPLGCFLAGPRRTLRAPDELLVAVHVPAAALAGRSAFVKLGARRHLVISIAMAAARIEVREGRVADAALSVGACSPVAVRLHPAEAALRGAPADAALPARLADGLVAPVLAPIDDVRADAAYRRRAAAEILRRAVAAALPTREAAAA